MSVDQSEREIKLIGSLSKTYETLEGRRWLIQSCMQTLDKGFLADEKYAEINQKYEERRKKFLEYSEGKKAEGFERIFGPRTKENDIDQIRKSIGFMDRHIANGVISDLETIERYNALKAQFTELQ